MMPMPREKWTDERLDDLNKKVDDGFARVDADLRGLRGDVNSQGNSLRRDLNSQGDSLRRDLNDQGKSLRGELNALRSEMNARFDSLNRNLLAGAIAIVAAVIGSNAL